MIDSVSIVRCEDYDFSSVAGAIQKAISFFGGIEAFINLGDKVLLKPNLLSASPPDSAIVTHPTIVEVLGKMVRRAGGSVIIADSPGAGIPYTVNALQKVYKTTGYDKLAQDNTFLLNFDTTWSLIANPRGKLIKYLEVINPVINCSKIINLPKFKTHTFTIFSGAVKNMFGIVPGFVKPSYHARLQNVSQFSEMLLDLLVLIKPILNVMDAVIGLEGDGPGALGKVRKINLIMVSPNPILLDVVACQIAGIDIEAVPFLVAAKKQGLIPNEIEILGGNLEEFKLTNFQKPKTYDPKGFGLKPTIQKLIAPIVKNLFSLKPIVLKSKCRACANCVKSCPTKAIKIVNKKAKINYRECIRCYCCIESCPEAAVISKLSPYAKFVQRRGVSGFFKTDIG
uniref:DUF362 domain-containing protein n=1 Tax=candidate division WOR-3 bacterium TaxID=2052148 RepID=A0A7C6EBW3_UNCW3